MPKNQCFTAGGIMEGQPLIEAKETKGTGRHI